MQNARLDFRDEELLADVIARLIGSDVLKYRDDWKVIDSRSAIATRSCCCRRSSRT